MKQSEQHPIVAGVMALVSVAVVVGLVVGVLVFLAANLVGLGDRSEATSRAVDPDGGATLYAPPPQPTKTATGLAITLHPSPVTAPEEGASASEETTAAAPVPTRAAEEKRRAKKITLQAGVIEAEPMQTIDLTGIYPGGEGAMLRLERVEGGVWKPFGIADVRVSGEQFAAVIQTGRVGRHKFRMMDLETGTYSNKVVVNVG